MPPCPWEGAQPCSVYGLGRRQLVTKKIPCKCGDQEHIS